MQLYLQVRKAKEAQKATVQTDSDGPLHRKYGRYLFNFCTQVALVDNNLLNIYADLSKHVPIVFKTYYYEPRGNTIFEWFHFLIRSKKR